MPNGQWRVYSVTSCVPNLPVHTRKGRVFGFIGSMIMTNEKVLMFLDLETGDQS